MKFTYKWLREYIKVDLPVEELIDKFTFLGLECETYENIKAKYDNVVVGEVVECEKHPEADKLSVCQVNVGGDEILQIVCGAPNVAKGQKVLVALVGAELGDFKIKKAKLRGVESKGMICAEDELGLGTDHSGIMVLNENAVIGENIADALNLEDYMIELELTPNRPDCLGVLGIAREVGLFTGNEVERPEIKFTENNEKAEDSIEVEIKNSDACPRYAAKVVKGVEIKESPDWLKNRLKAIGLRPRNNVVDITNFVMMEYGHPIHAFDLKEITGSKIIVRNAEAGEKFTTLDDTELELSGSELMIADAERSVALAGVMGGQNSEINDTTKDVLIECAYFDPVSVRQTAKKHGIKTDSSHRFERGVDPNHIPEVVNRVAQLIQDLAGGEVLQGTVDVYPKVIKNAKIDLSLDRVNALLGVNLEMKEVKDILAKLGFKVGENTIKEKPVILSENETKELLGNLLTSIDKKDTSNNDLIIEKTEYKKNHILTQEEINSLQKAIENSEKITVEVPTYRPDITREADLIEEIARVYGYDKIPYRHTDTEMLVTESNSSYEKRRNLTNYLVDLGFYELLNYSFVAPETLDKLNFSEDDRRRKYITLFNPLREDQSIMRTNLLASLIEKCVYNYNRDYKDARVFEINKVYFNIPNVEEKLYSQEEIELTAMVYGRRYPKFWSDNARKVDFYDVKGYVEGIFELLDIEDYTLVPSKENYLHPGQSADIFYKNIKIGELGLLHPDVMENFEVEEKIYTFSIYLTKIFDLSKERNILYTELNRLPGSQRDMSFLIKDEIGYGEVYEELTKLKKSANIEKITLVDLYKGKNIADGFKSFCVSITYRVFGKTLTDEAVNKLHDKVVKQLQNKFNIEIR